MTTFAEIADSDRILGVINRPVDLDVVTFERSGRRWLLLAASKYGIQRNRVCVFYNAAKAADIRILDRVDVIVRDILVLDGVDEQGKIEVKKVIEIADKRRERVF